jgi:membrane-bound lytic murein transglycosylase A
MGRGLRPAVVSVITIALAVSLARDAAPPRLGLTLVGFDALPGWANDDLSSAIAAFLRSCVRFSKQSPAAPFGPIDRGIDYGQVADWLPVCSAAGILTGKDETAVRRFFESALMPMAVADYDDGIGLFTGYFEIELNGSRHRHGHFQTPIYRRPPDLGVTPSYSRAQIEEGALAHRGLELFWVDNPIDAFFLQIQGSGRIRLEDGQDIRVGYDGQNGLPYVAVGRLLLERGEIPRGKVTMASIRAWMRAHPQAGAALRREDPSYVFFRIIKGDGPIGAEGVALTSERSLAVDRSYIPLGVPIWLAASEQFIPDVAVRRLVMAQDTGGAIKGPVRGDLFWGADTAAGNRAGEMDARGRYYLLLPRAAATRLAAEEERR